VDNTVLYTFGFSEAVTGFDTSDVTVTGGTKGAFTAGTDGKTYTVEVTADDNSTTSLSVTAGNTGVADTAGNALAASATNSAQAVDTVNPTATVTDNVSGTVNAATTSVAYTYTFSEAVTGLTASDFTVTNGTIGTVSGSGTTWTVNVTPATGVASGNIGLTLAAGGVADTAGNTNLVFTSADQAIDNVAPTVATLSPADDGNSLGLAANLLMNFAETMAKGTSGNIVIYKGTDNSVVETIAVTSSQVTITGAQVAINPTADLVKDQTYYVKIDAGALVDSAGNAYTGITTTTAWNFTGAGATVTINAVAGDNTVNLSESGSAISVGGTLVAEAAVLAAFTASDFTSAVLKPATGSSIALSNLVYDPVTHAWTAQIASGALSGTADYTLEVTMTGSQGAAANIVGFGSQVVRVDTVVATPTLALATNSGDANDSLTNVGTVNVSGIESGATWQYSTDAGTNWTAGTGTSFTLSGDGAKSAIVRQTDAAGNASANSSALAFTLDTAAPATTSLSPADNGNSLGLAGGEPADELRRDADQGHGQHRDLQGHRQFRRRDDCRLRQPDRH
ncbi:MAG: Ig-like domain-containing protein, partial [Rhodocyclales bacterium]|nr:Ig-like domain-containing protein [Rhodocyclales bacterium]